MKIRLSEPRSDLSDVGQVADLTRTTCPTRPSPLWFWLLVLSASAMFAPCVLVPVWKDYQAIKLAERFEVAAVEEMRRDTERQERTLDALRTDPGTVARVAQRDLAYTQRGTTSVHVQTVPMLRTRAVTSTIDPVQLPIVVARALGWLSIKPTHLEVFADFNVRTTVMCLSGGLILAACLIFPPRRRDVGAAGGCRVGR